MWSLGCILYLMAFGKPPFAHITKITDKERAICDPQHCIDIPPDGGSCDPELEDVLRVSLTSKRSTIFATDYRGEFVFSFGGLGMFASTNIQRT